MSPVLVVLDRELVFLGMRLSKYRREADKTAARKGQRDFCADTLCDRTDERRTELREARATVAELLALAQQYASECASCDGRGLVHVSASLRSMVDLDGDEPCPDCADIRAVIAKAVHP